MLLWMSELWWVSTTSKLQFFFWYPAVPRSSTRSPGNATWHEPRAAATPRLEQTSNAARISAAGAASHARASQHGSQRSSADGSAWWASTRPSAGTSCSACESSVLPAGWSAAANATSRWVGFFKLHAKRFRSPKRPMDKTTNNNHCSFWRPKPFNMKLELKLTMIQGWWASFCSATLLVLKCN